MTWVDWPQLLVPSPDPSALQVQSRPFFFVLPFFSRGSTPAKNSIANKAALDNPLARDTGHIVTHPSKSSHPRLNGYRPQVTMSDDGYNDDGPL